MAYRFAVSAQSYADYSSGGVLRSAPGFPAFPVRLASEILQRALAHRAASRAVVWDPCCGSGYLVTALSLLHPHRIERVIASDADPAALELAAQNLALLSEQRMLSRSAELRERAARLGRPSYAEVADAAGRFARRLAAHGGAVGHTLARADVQGRHSRSGALPGGGRVAVKLVSWGRTVRIPGGDP